MNYEWQIRLQWEIGMAGYALYIFRNNHDGTRDFKTADGDVTVKDNTKSSKYLFMHIFDDTSQLRQLIEEAEKQGVRAPSTDTALGELKATKTHLQDLRHMLKLPTPTNLKED